MITELIETLFEIIQSIDCWDMEDPSCIDGASEALSAITSIFFQFSIFITLLFILLASIFKYQFKKSALSDIAWRRVVFFLGWFINYYFLNLFANIAVALSETRADSDVASEVVSSAANNWMIIGIALYPIVFFGVAFLFNTVFKRRKLYSIFRSNNKLFGLI
jgi:hypothetical protein